MKIGIITGTIREGRKNLAVANWVKQVADLSGLDAEFELVDIKDYQLPFFDDPMSPAYTEDLKYRDVQKPWADKMAELDGYIFVTPEYNHSIPAALKNNLDYVYHELTDKAAGIVSYGAQNGIRAAEHLRNILAEFQVATVRSHPSLSIFTDWKEGEISPNPAVDGAMTALFYQLGHWTKAMQAVREAKANETK